MISHKAPVAPGSDGLDAADEVDYGNPVDPTLITSAPRPPDDDRATEQRDSVAPMDGDADDVDEDADMHVPDEDGPTIQRDFRDVPPARAPKKPAPKAKPAAPPPALAAKIHSPAVSELRKPRPSRKTPPGGTPAPNVLQAIVGAQTSEPMPAPRSATPPAWRVPTPPAAMPTAPRVPTPPAVPQQQPMPMPMPMPPLSQQLTPPPEPLTNPLNPQIQPQFQMQPPQPMMMQPPQPMGYPPPPAPGPYGTNPPAYNGYGNYDPSALSTPPPGFPVQPVPGVPAHLQPYAQQMYPQAQSPYPSYPSYPPTPGAFYAHQPQPYGQQPMPPTLTGALRLSEGDELNPAYNLSRGRSWGKLIAVGVLAVAVAAGVTLFVLRQRDAGPTSGQFRIVTTPPNAEITYDSNRLTDKTPDTIDGVPTGTRHEIEITLAHYEKVTRTVDMPKIGGEVEVDVILKPILGKLRVVSTPDKAEIRIDGQLRGKTPITINDIDLTAQKVELRLAGYQPYSQPLAWPSNGEIDIDAKLQK